MEWNLEGIVCAEAVESGDGKGREGVMVALLLCEWMGWDLLVRSVGGE